MSKKTYPQNLDMLSNSAIACLEVDPVFAIRVFGDAVHVAGHASQSVDIHQVADSMPPIVCLICKCKRPNHRWLDMHICDACRDNAIEEGIKALT